MPTPGGPTKQRIGSRGDGSVAGGLGLGVGAASRTLLRPSTTAGRPRLALLAQLLDRQVLQDPVLDLLQVVVVLVQDLAGLRHVDLAAGQRLQGRLAIQSR